MKRLTALVFVLVSLASIVPTAQGQQPHRFRFDSGLVTPGPNQILRITIASNVTHNTELWEWVKSVYSAGECSGDVCRNALASRIESGRMRLLPREAMSIDIPHSPGGVRGEVLSPHPEGIRVTFQIIDTITGTVTAFYEGWPCKW